jgi:IS5 family transposase
LTWSVNVGKPVSLTETILPSTARQSPPTKRNNRSHAVRKQGTQTGVPSTIRLATNSRGLATRYTLQWTQHSELPVSLEVTPAHVYDGEMAIPLMKDVAENLGWKFKSVMMDAGYDQVKNYETARSYGAQAIIALNRRGEKEPPAGMSSNGTPRCSMGYDMVYWGADGDRLKFRCPHVLGKVDCPLGAAACSDSNYGMVLKQNIADDVRRFSNPHRNTRRWTELYNERTAVERCNSRLKENLTANDVHVSGIDKVTTHVYLNAIVLLASALAMSNNAANMERVA